MKKMISLLLLLPLITSCTFFGVHKMNIEQGNILSQPNLNRIHIGMTPDSVKNILGEPIMVNIFTPHQLAYVYTMQSGYQPIQIKKTIFWFEKGRLINIQKQGF